MHLGPTMDVISYRQTSIECLGSTRCDEQVNKGGNSFRERERVGHDGKEMMGKEEQQEGVTFANAIHVSWQNFNKLQKIKEK